MNSAIEATTPLRSGQETRRMAELCINKCSAGVLVGYSTAGTAALLLQRLRNLTRRVGARAAGQSGSRMGSAATQIQALDRRLIPRPVEQGTHGEERSEEHTSELQSLRH